MDEKEYSTASTIERRFFNILDILSIDCVHLRVVVSALLVSTSGSHMGNILIMKHAGSLLTKTM